MSPVINIKNIYYSLIYNFKFNIISNIEFTKNQYNYFPTEKILYFDVKTPTTQFFYEKFLYYGEIIKLFFTFNLNKNLNYSIQYERIQLKDKYINQLFFNNYFLITFNYHTDDQFYKLWGYYIKQSIENKKIINIINFKKKSIYIKLYNNNFNNQRYYFGESLKLYLDTIKITHRIQYSKKKNIYQENYIENFYDVTYFNDLKKDKSYYTSIKNELTITFHKKILLEGGISHNQIIYNFPFKYKFSNFLITQKKIQKNILLIIGNIHYNSKLFFILCNIKYNPLVTTDYSFFLNTKLEIKFFKNFQLGCNSLFSIIFPTFNSVIYQSFYIDKYYDPNIHKIKIQSLNVYLLLNKNISLYLDILSVTNYICFNLYNKFYQENNILNLFKIKIQDIINIYKIRLKNSFQYQNIISGDNTFFLPNFIFQSSLYYEYFFAKEKLLVQTGITINYSDNFNFKKKLLILNKSIILPIDNNFFLKKINKYYFLDYFINFEIYRMKFYVCIKSLNNDMLIKKNNFLLINKKWINNNKLPNIFIKIGISWNLFT